jgi:hypothetical protein
VCAALVGRAEQTSQSIYIVSYRCDHCRGNWADHFIGDRLTMWRESDYLRVVEKFDACRAAIARHLERHGIDPSDAPDNLPWHEWLIEKLDSLEQASLQTTKNKVE